VPDWRSKANCLDHDTEGFYPPREKGLYQEVASAAKKVCFSPGVDGTPNCSAQKRCLLFAIDQDEKYGIWGGMSHRERNALVRRADRLNSPIDALIP
jgi:WhiB family redox-sensing transcriptional regulator